jgi:hypothetical protein
MTPELDAEDAKLVTLARASRARTSARQGAAVRDLDGRTYAAATVALDALAVDALDLAVAMAVSSGAKGLEAGAVVAEAEQLETVSLEALTELAGADRPVYTAGPDGTVTSVRHS